MDQKLIETKEKLLNSLIAGNKVDEALDEIEKLNHLLNSNNIGNEIIDIRSIKNDLEQQINDEIITQENVRIGKGRIRKKITDLKDDVIYFLEHGKERTPQPPSPSTNQLDVQTKITIIDIAIVVLTSLVFIVLLVAFAIGLLKDPMNFGLIAFASAIMIAIILYLRKYKRDMGKGVYQMR